MRLLLRLLARLLGLALAGAGAVLALEAGWALARPDSDSLVVPWTQWREQLADYAWADIEVLVAGGVLAGVGLLLLLLARGARRHDVRLISPADGVAVVTSPRALARVVGHRVRAEDGVRTASVTASRRRLRVRASSGLHTEAQLRSTVAGVVAELVGDLPLVRRPRVRVQVGSSRDRR